MRKVILQLELDPRDASIKGILRKLRIEEQQIDLDFGVRVVRQERNVYAIRIDADVAAGVRAEHGAAHPASAGDVQVSLVH
jgi:hypothetical protein